MACPKSAGAQPRSRGRSIDAAFLFNHKSNLNSEMQSLISPGESGEDLSKLMKRLRQMSWAADSNRRSSLNADRRDVSSYENRDRRSSLGPRYNGYQLDSHKVGQWDVKSKVPKRWLKEYEKKQAELRKERKKKLKPLDRFRRAGRLIQTCNTAFRSIVHYAIEKGQHEQVQSDVTVSLKTATVQGAVENLMFDPEHYKCHHEFLMPRWAKEITSKEPASRTLQEIHSVVQLMKQLKGFRRYSSKMQKAVCKALKYDCFGRRRVVIRKGHVAQRFYFIFSGSVCVTVDDDEHSAFAKPTENSVLKRGDYFGELAFIRGIERSATVVCLERTELLSVEKEDFFSAKIDQCFNADTQKRVEFLKEHHLFSTWPDDVVKKVAEESRLQDYNSDEVIVRDSSDLHWMIFVTKGQCDVLRLLDLSNCKDYIEHAVKYRMNKIKDDTAATYTPNADDISLSSIVLQRFPPRAESPECDPATSSKKTSSARGGARAEAVRVHPGGNQAGKVSAKGILHSEKSNGKLRKGHVSFRVEGEQDLNNTKEQCASPEPIRVLDITDKEVETEVDKGLTEEREEGNVGVGVFMMVDRIRPGQVFGSWCLLDQEDASIPPFQNVSSNCYQLKNDSNNRRLNKKKKPRERRFTLVSGGCEVIKVAKEVFYKYSDEATIEKLRKLTTTYPRDSILCRAYLQQSDWRTYREEIVDNVVVRHIARLERAKGSARSHNVRSSPVPSPLCSMKMWPSVKSEWEYFPDTGWVMGQVTRPVVEAGTSRANSATKKDHSEVSPAYQSSQTTRKCSAPSIRTTHGPSGTNRRFSGTTCASSGTSPRSSLKPRVSSGPPRLSFGTHRGSPVPYSLSPRTTCAFSGASPRSSLKPRVSSGTHRGSPVPYSSLAMMPPEKLLPLVTNDLVLAQGSQRTLVLTQGGGRCNDYQLQIERNIINEYDLKKSTTQLGKVT